MGILGFLVVFYWDTSAVHGSICTRNMQCHSLIITLGSKIYMILFAAVMLCLL